MNMGKKATVGALIASLTFLGCQEKKAQQTPEEEVQESIDGSAADTVETGSSEQNSAGATAEGTTPDQPAQPAQPNQPETKRSGPVIPEFQDVKLDFPAEYCSNVHSLKLRTNIQMQLDMFCGNGKPTELFYKMMNDALDQKDGPVVYDFLVEHHEEKELTKMILGWSFHVPVHPFKIKALPLHTFLHPGFKAEGVDFKAEENEGYQSSTDGGLHLWSVSQKYDVDIATPVGSKISQTRNTEYNVYQLLSGNDEMGLAVEHLIDEDNQFYKASDMVSVSFNDGNNEGFVMTFVYLLLNNQGFPETTANGFREITKGMAQLVYDGIKENGNKEEDPR